MEAMSTSDRLRWDENYAGRPAVDPDAATAPADFTDCEQAFPAVGTALDIACGRGGAAVWLARRGLQVWGIDVSAVAIEQARELAAHWGVSDRCRFSTADLDVGLPPGPAADVIVCHRFRDPGLYPAISDRLAPGGLLAISVLSEVGGAPGRFRATSGELTAAFGTLTTIAAGEADGIAWLLARKP